MKVAMVSPWKVKCGIFTYTENLVNALAEQDVTVYIVRLPRFGTKSEAILQNVVDKIPADKIDIIHVQEEYGLYQGLDAKFFQALKRLGKPVVTTMHSVGKWDADTVISTVSKRVIVHNEFCKRRFKHPCTVIAHGAKPVECPPREECKKALGINPKIPIIGYVGFITSYKGLEVLIEAVSKIPKVALLIGGGWHATGVETQYISQLKRWSLKLLPARCQWLGFVADERLATVYGAMNVVCYPSRFSTESGALIMALSHGKAVLASHLPPFVEKEKVAALKTFKNVKDLRRKLKRLLKDESLRRKLEEGAKAYVQETAWTKKIAEKHISLYTQVITECSVKETKGNG